MMSCKQQVCVRCSNVNDQLGFVGGANVASYDGCGETEIEAYQDMYDNNPEAEAVNCSRLE